VSKFFPEEKEVLENIKNQGQKLQKTSAEIIKLKEQGVSGDQILEKKEKFEEDEQAFLRIINELGEENFYSLGLYEINGNKGFNMTALGLRTSLHHNAVSRLHCQVAQEMFQNLFDEEKMQFKENYNPLTYITNGVHVPSFISKETRDIFTFLDSNWIKNYDVQYQWKKMFDKLSDQQIWEYHINAKNNLFRFIRETSRSKLQSGEWSLEKAIINGSLLDPNAFTIGFARRFATYKRATLLFNDLERLKKLFNDPYKPIQIIFSGKAHPADDPGKKLIQEIVQYAQDPSFGFRIAFLEDYDLVIGKALTQGVDVWLNNPLRPYEASGTSGMKAAINFTPNLSILDGWWAEGYNKDLRNGWAINEANIKGQNRDEQDKVDANSLYDLLEQEVTAMYYNIDPDDKIPKQWVKYMRNSVTEAIVKFSSRRMIKEYAQNIYTKMVPQRELVSEIKQ
ncbi:MAG: alpha-glucan family phosphorylase, partial [Candidatus Thorarchaeota archaeon]